VKTIEAIAQEVVQKDGESNDLLQCIPKEILEAKIDDGRAVETLRKICNEKRKTIAVLAGFKPPATKEEEKKMFSPEINQEEKFESLCAETILIGKTMLIISQLLTEPFFYPNPT
jgi:hypothetical protein